MHIAVHSILQEMAPAPAFSPAWGQPQPQSPSAAAAAPDGVPHADAGINMTLALTGIMQELHKARRLKVHHVLQGVAPAPAYTSAWGQPQPPSAAAAPDGAPYADAGINMTLALTGVSANTLTPAARQAITNAVAQQVSSVGERLSHKSCEVTTARSSR